MKLQEVFPAEYVSLVKKHASRIGQVVASYDIVIFMARKAICLSSIGTYESLRCETSMVRTNILSGSSRLLLLRIEREHVSIPSKTPLFIKKLL